MPAEARWLTKRQALDESGLPYSQLRRLVKAGIVKTTGTGKSMRYGLLQLQAALLLWDALDPLLPEAEAADLKQDEE